MKAMTAYIMTRLERAKPAGTRTHYQVHYPSLLHIAYEHEEPFIIRNAPVVRTSTNGSTSDVYSINSDLDCSRYTLPKHASDTRGFVLSSLDRSSGGVGRSGLLRRHLLRFIRGC